MQTKPLER